jgi:hypothetical protein
MTKATRVLSTPPTNTPIDKTRRRFLAVAAVASVASVGTLAVAAMPAAAPDSAACAADPAFALIAEKLAADAVHCEAIDAQDEAESGSGFGSDAAWEASERCCIACQAVNEADWRLAQCRPRCWPASPRCSGSPMKSRTAAWSGRTPTRSVARVGTPSCGRSWRPRSRH